MQFNSQNVILMNKLIFPHQGAKRRRDDGGRKSGSESQAYSHQPHPWHALVCTPHHGPQHHSAPLSCFFTVYVWA